MNKQVPMQIRVLPAWIALFVPVQTSLFQHRCAYDLLLGGSLVKT